MSSLPPSSTPSEGDDSAPVSLPAADAAPESVPVAAAAAEPSPPPADDAPAAEAQPAGQAARPAPEDCGPQLKALYPALFSNPPKPLKLRIQADIQARTPGQFTKPQLSAFLRRYTGSHAYLNALVKATHRFDLDGNPGDELSEEHRNAAVEELARRRANTQARIALEHEQRANRATLLKEYEANTLPAAEFAASKGIAEAELEPLIARARKEATEPPPAPAFNRDRRGPQQKRGPRPEGQRGARPPRDAQAAPAADGAAPQADGEHAPRAPRPPRADGPRGPRPEGQRGPRGDRPQGPRADGPRGPRPEGARPQNAGPRSDAPRGPRRDDDRRPRQDDARPQRANVSSTPAAPTAMALAFSALNALKTKK
ncbi:MAG TPA: ProQ/FINO family protein [Burkholderiaceae bacterium]|nr:ProQ/FINO family protein [Burkholderiaceae bacterium]